MIDLVITFVALVPMMIFYGIEPTLNMLWLPLLVLTAVMAAAGVGIGMAALSVSYHDFRYVVPFLVSIGFFLSGVMTDSEQIHWALHLNPMSGTIGGFKSSVLGGAIDGWAWVISASSAVALLLISLAYFARVQRHFADVV